MVCSCGNRYETRSTAGGELHVELCNQCHPFFTGQQKFVDTGGRVQRFSDKFGNAATAVLEKEAAEKDARRKAAEEAAVQAKQERDAKAAEKAAKAAQYEAKAAARGRQGRGRRGRSLPPRTSPMTSRSRPSTRHPPPRPSRPLPRRAPSRSRRLTRTTRMGRRFAPRAPFSLCRARPAREALPRPRTSVSWTSACSLTRLIPSAPSLSRRGSATRPVGAAELMEHMDDDAVRKVLRVIMTSGHISALEHASYTFAIDGVSRALTHQLVRHRLASYNQQSQRYVSYAEEPAFVVPPAVDGGSRALRERF